MDALIFVNGPPNDLPTPRQVPAVDLVIAADGGTANARRLGIIPSVIIGDLDSLSATDRAELEGPDTQFLIYPTNKDATDLELALRHAIKQGAHSITLVGALGGRPDQSLANVLLLTLPFLAGTRVTLLGKGWEAFCIRTSATVHGHPGDVVSLLPLTPEVTGVTTAGLFWGLDEATLKFGSTLSVSNSMTGHSMEVSIHHGVLLVVHLTSDSLKGGKTLCQSVC